MSIRKGARVVPLELAANVPRQAAAISAQGKAGREPFILIVKRLPFRDAAIDPGPWAGGSIDQGSLTE
jgi:hypothetical protein